MLIKTFLQGLGITEEAVKAHIRPGTNNFITQVQICMLRCQPVAPQNAARATLALAMPIDVWHPEECLGRLVRRLSCRCRVMCMR